MSNNQPLQSRLLIRAFLRFPAAILVLSVMLFLPAGTFDYWQAWVYIAIMLLSSLIIMIYLLKSDTGLLARRMRIREKETKQKLIMKTLYILFFLTFLLPGFDKRFGWSNVPAGAVVVADILVLLGYGLVFLTFKENRYASRIIEVEQGQTVISSGPYAIVRHPMYSGAIPLYIFSPLALGSYWAMIPAVLIIPFFVARILNEESVLTRDLNGYQEYMQKTHYRLIPGIW